MDTISGSAFRAVEVAVKEFERRGLKIERYRISVTTVDHSVVVSFQDENRKPGQRGSSPNAIGFDVVLDKERLQIIRSSYSK